MNATPEDWVSLSMVLRETSGVFYLPWEGYARYFSEPSGIDNELVSVPQNAINLAAYIDTIQMLHLLSAAEDAWAAMTKN